MMKVVRSTIIDIKKPIFALIRGKTSKVFSKKV